MGVSKKTSKLIKNGFSGKKKKIGINYWRFYFSGTNTLSSAETVFFVEFKMLNPWISPSDVALGFKPRVKITQDDLQYALAGTSSAIELETESIIQPSYCSVSVGKFGDNSKQLCAYFPVKEINFEQKPFQFTIGNKFFSDNKISGFMSISEEDKKEHPEYFSDAGYASWNLDYEVRYDSFAGYKSKSLEWYPCGLQVIFSGKINFDGTDYLVDSRKSAGYMERFWGNTLPEPLFHVSSTTFTSIITGKTLHDSAFVVKGGFNNDISFIGKLEDLQVEFTADKAKKTYTSVWECVQAPESENPEENKLHWAISINHKDWIIDIDIYCKIKDLINHSIELPEGNRSVLNLLEGTSGFGELKIYKQSKNTLEQIEHAKITKAICQFGHHEEGQI